MTRRRIQGDPSETSSLGLNQKDVVDWQAFEIKDFEVKQNFVGCDKDLTRSILVSFLLLLFFIIKTCSFNRRVKTFFIAVYKKNLLDSPYRLYHEEKLIFPPMLSLFYTCVFRVKLFWGKKKKPVMAEIFLIPCVLSSVEWWTNFSGGVFFSYEPCVMRMQY